MARATTKAELLDAAAAQWDKMWQQLDSLTEEEQNTPFFFDASGEKEAHWSRDKNMRDVIVHLYEWHQLLLNWVKANKKSESKPFLPGPYNWKTYGAMNVELWRKNQSTTYTDAKPMLRKSHNDVLALIHTFTDEELFEKKHYSWTGTSHLGSYCISATSSHYDWAIKKIKRHTKALKAV